MTRFWPCALLIALAQPAWAGEAPYYGPAKRWHGIGYEFGYKDVVEKDGTWRVDAAIHGRGEAIDMAMYRAAERARDAGYRYIFFLGGSASTSPGISSASIRLRPSNEPVAPVGCRSKRAGTCYTADVAEVLRVLGGPGGTQPGVAIVDHLDKFGREVRLSGYGTGGIAALGGAAVPRSSTATVTDGRVVISGGRAMADRIAPAATTAAPVAWAEPESTPAPVLTASIAADEMALPRHAPDLAAQNRFERAARANQPVHGREPQLGWTISD